MHLGDRLCSGTRAGGYRVESTWAFVSLAVEALSQHLVLHLFHKVMPGQTFAFALHKTRSRLYLSSLSTQIHFLRGSTPTSCNWDHGLDLKVRELKDYL